MQLKINIKSVALYVAYALTLVGINAAVKGVPLGLGLCFAMLGCGASAILSTTIYVLAGIINLSLTFSLTNLFEGAFVGAITFIYRRAHKKMSFEGGVYLLIALSPFVAFSPWQGLDVLSFLQNAYIIRCLAALVVALFSFFCYKSVYALFFRLYRCRLRPDELLSLCIVFVAFGVGVVNLLGIYAFCCLAILPIVLSIRLFKNPSALIVACATSLPCALCELSVQWVTIAVAFCLILLLFCGTGRFALGGVSLVICAVAFYFGGKLFCAVLCLSPPAPLAFCRPKITFKLLKNGSKPTALPKAIWKRELNFSRPKSSSA
jgi:hypothetical protein